MSTPDKDRLRIELLEAVYDFAEASHRPRQGALLERDKWADEMGYDRDAVRRTDDWLRDRGLVDHPSMGDLVVITPAGQDEVERVRSYRVTAAANAVRFVSPQDMARLEPMVEAVQRFLDEHGDQVDVEDAASLRAALDVIRLQRRTERPSEEVVRGSVRMIKWIVTEMGASMVGTATVLLIDQALGLFS